MLRAELRKRPLVSTSDRRMITQQDIQALQDQVDSLSDENVSLKLKVSDLEQELVDERYKKKLHFEVTVEGVKA